MYNVNDYVVYMHETCKILEVKNIKDKKYYVLKPINDNSLKISVPCDNKNIKRIISKEKIDSLINNIPNILEINDLNKNLDSKYKELLNNNSYEDLIRIIKTTYLRNMNRLNNKKKISDKDEYYFLLAEKYLYSEMSITLNMPIEEVREYIKKKLEC